jgi:hypothetical protein
VIVCLATLLVIGCGNSTGPAEESYSWEQYEWTPVDRYNSDACQISYTIRNDSIYIIGVQEADTSHYCRCNMPDIVSFEVLLDGQYPDSYHRDGTMALTAAGSLQTDDWYEYYYPYGLGKESLEQSIPNQPDTSLAGVNDVVGVFWGELNGDSTVVFRKSLVTNDLDVDIPLEIGETYGVCIYLQWNSPGDPNYYSSGRDDVELLIL